MNVKESLVLLSKKITELRNFLQSIVTIKYLYKKNKL